MAVPTVTAPASPRAPAVGLDARHAPLAVVIRGEAAESVHSGSPNYAVPLERLALGFARLAFRGAGIGIAIKIANGSKRALRPIIASVLEQLRLLDAKSRAELADWFAPVVTNYRGIATGRILPLVVLDKIPAS